MSLVGRVLTIAVHKSTVRLLEGGVGLQIFRNLFLWLLRKIMKLTVESQDRTTGPGPLRSMIQRPQMATSVLEVVTQ